MALNVIPPHIPNDCSNHEALLQEDEVFSCSEKAEGDIGPQEDDTMLVLLQFEIPILD